MFLASQQDKDLLGLRRILEAAPCLSPRGRQIQQAMTFYQSKDLEALAEEFHIMEQLRAFGHDQPESVLDAEAVLSRLRPLQLSLKGLADGRIMDESEFFELKRNLRLQRQIGKQTELFVQAELDLIDLDEAWQILNPQGSDPNGFHVYTAYSDKLQELRHEKRKLETQIIEARPADRPKLLEDRAIIHANEKSVERQVLKELGQKLRPYHSAWTQNLDQLGILDFRLARIKLADRWNSPSPSFLAQGQGVHLVKAREPWLAEKLEDQGEDYTPQSLDLCPGATVITGANMGGKSIALRSVLMQVMLVQLGYYPACQSLEMEVFDFFAFTTDNPGESDLGLSSFGMEAGQLREQLRLIKDQKGFVVLDEPARGTNPKEAAAIVTGLCRIFAQTDSYLVIATHYRIPPSEGIRYYQIKGLQDTVFTDQVRPYLPPAHEEGQDRDQRIKEDMAAARRIRKNMDYRLMPTDGHSRIPAEALRIAEWMGVDPEAIEVMRQAYMEEK